MKVLMAELPTNAPDAESLPSSISITEFEIHASGQHDIGGPLWHPEGKKLGKRKP